MKRTLAAAVAAATLLGAAPAQAAAPDPVRAVKRQLVVGHGVKISETVSAQVKGKKDVYFQTAGTFGFGTSGVVAADLTLRTTLISDKPTSMRLLMVGKRAYMRSDAIQDHLPEGKTWVRMEDDESLRTPSSQPVDLFRPPQLKGLLSYAESVRNGVRRGTVTGKQGYRISEGRVTGTFDFRLSTDSTGLPTRLHTTTQDFDSGPLEHVDTRYSAWGHSVTITDPPDHEVVGLDELASSLEWELEEYLEIADDAVASARR
ncbi:hypothetical protein HD597_009106 [Nonomuraea thailandensis]|uniref:LppX_LprAFG lipoprotein n=1 Tax=Nonomuraea thailandensis TaxID=1188745 RepID=A0A9X2GUP6_9ACTN|nr:hypothetical protein [Nonomuraea thailandensis]MCP2362086.1 hypothetical protein [Nonomuraea thailandensis]